MAKGKWQKANGKKTKVPSAGPECGNWYASLPHLTHLTTYHLHFALCHLPFDLVF